ncbi:MAG: bifunctional isocitrate dehydrogenase kinase/phosphatase [Acidobacteria bacterium]|nr:bifunctional isocitrate dehydrogenase kinase/phosphatase [Acidobacteriota bacterium]
MNIEELAINNAEIIISGFKTFNEKFKEITRRAKNRFETRNTYGFYNDANERLDLYTQSVMQIVKQLKENLSENTEKKEIWVNIKKNYTKIISKRGDLEIAETFFNSITRKIFTTTGVDPDIEYVASDFETFPPPSEKPIYYTYKVSDLVSTIKEILGGYNFNIYYEDVLLDSKLIAEKITQEVGYYAPKIEVLKSIFYRNKKAYIIGRICYEYTYVPLAIVLLNKEGGMIVDAALLTQNEISIVFSFTRSYFHVEVERPQEMVSFLKSIMPLKPVAELYISIGFNKHGKTELYRDLLDHLERSSDKFEFAKGKKGMVMSVFTLPSYDVVFKIIKDKPEFPKKSTRQDVIDKYNLVFTHDRAGRLVDAQEFEHLEFEKSRFSEDLLAELLKVAAKTVFIEGENVVIKHLYTERKLIPLNIFIKEMPLVLATEAIQDYGNAIKDLVAANIFPGDILLKNFGVTRHGRVIFYDYDELCLITECNFRAIPPARNYYDELDSEPWFHVGENDIFPEEFKSFIDLEGELREVLLKLHGDLFNVKFWLDLQNRIKAGEVLDIFPYKGSQRFVRENIK